MTDLDKIDLELFKVCYPKATDIVLSQDKIMFDLDGIPDGIYRFTDSIFGVVSIYKYLIPEMNRRGFELDLEQDHKGHVFNNGEWWCSFNKISTGASRGMAWASEPQVAISLAAEKVIDSLSCGWCHAPLDENGDCQNDK